jgi:hypothetical protein
MSKSGGWRRGRRFKASIGAVCVVAIVGVATPALGLTGLLTGVLNHVNAAPNVPAATNAPLALNQLTTILNQVNTSLTSIVNGAGPVIDMNVTPAATVAITQLQTRLNNTIAAAAAANADGVNAETAALLAYLQAQATAEVAAVPTLALTTGLSVVQHVVSPVCSLLALPTTLVPGVGLDLSRTYKALEPNIQATDLATSQQIQGAWKTLYDTILTSATTAAGPAGAILSLLKFNWTTSYTPPGSTTPIVHSTPALIDVPTPIDVDNSGSFDLCGTLAFSIQGSSIKFTQTITKMPLAPANLPVTISGGLLNVLNLGYDTQDSTAPIVFSTSASIDGTGFNVDNAYGVHRGMNLSLPPLELQPGLTEPTFPPLLVPAPTPKMTQQICLGACSTLAFSYRYEDMPDTTHVHNTTAPVPSGDFSYKGSAPGGLFSYTFSAAGLKYKAQSVPAPADLRLCYSTTAGTCTNAPAADVAAAKSSLGVETSQPIKADAYFQLTAGAEPTTCSALSSLYDYHLTGAGYHQSFTPVATGTPIGRMWVDTDNKPVEGCISMLAATAAMPAASLPAGFTASKRSSTFHTGNVVETKSGTVTCPTGTSYSVSLLTSLTHTVCFAPTGVGSTKPAITGEPFFGSVLTSSNGTWTNAPISFTRQWGRCDAGGGGCSAIPGATDVTYTTTGDDVGHTLAVMVTATNPDGSAMNTSPATPVITVAGPPTNTAAPVVSGTTKVGQPLTTTNGTWTNAPKTFTYRWIRCDANGVDGCDPVAGATTNTLVPTDDDKGHLVKAEVTASNTTPDGTVQSTVATSLGTLVPTAPVVQTAPVIKNGPVTVGGSVVFTGDHLTVTNGTWNPAASGGYAYLWHRCDLSGGDCHAIDGATSNAYVPVKPDDAAHTLRVKVTATGVNGSTETSTVATGEVIAASFPLKTPTAVPDGPVTAVAGSYVGGQFDTVGPPTGASAAIAMNAASSATGTPANLPSEATGGSVLATVGDGAGGYFLGGSFTQVKGEPCANLAHIRADGSRDPAYCGLVSGTVKALSRASNANAGNLLAVGGEFSVDGHSNLVFIEPSAQGRSYLTGGDPNARVNALAYNATATSSGSPAFWVGGAFDTIGGNPAGRLALVNITTPGATPTLTRSTAFLGGVCMLSTPAQTSGQCTDAAAEVRTLYNSSLGIFVGGTFSSAYKMSAVAAGATIPAVSGGSGALPRGNGALITSAGTVQGWNPNTNGAINAFAGAPTPTTTATGSLGPYTVYVGGEFTTLAGQDIPYLGEFGVSITGGTAAASTPAAQQNAAPSTSFVPRPNAPVSALVSGPTNGASPPRASLYVGGDFTQIGSEVRHRLAVIDGQAALSTTPGALSSTLIPHAGGPIRALSTDSTPSGTLLASTTVFVGGDFRVVGGVVRRNLAEIGSSGVTGWNPGLTGTTVDALASDGGTVYVGGTFSQAGGASRTNLAALDGTSGAATSWAASANGRVRAIAVDDDNVYVGGDFDHAGGAARASLAAIGRTSGTATGWDPGTDGSVRALSVHSGTVYVGGSFHHAGGAARDNAAAIGDDGVATGFAPQVDGTVNAVAYDPSGVYLGGDFAHAGGAGRSNLALVGADDGVAGSWGPVVDGTVKAITTLGDTVAIGGAFGHVDGHARANLAALDIGGGVQDFNPNPNGTVNSLGRTTTGGMTAGGLWSRLSIYYAPGFATFGG